MGSDCGAGIDLDLPAPFDIDACDLGTGRDHSNVYWPTWRLNRKVPMGIEPRPRHRLSSMGLNLDTARPIAWWKHNATFDLG